MTENHIRNLDLNLVRVFLAVWETRSVSDGADRLGLSQSGMSRALGRLREALGDELFIRSGSGMIPTPLAERVGPKLRQALDQFEHALTRAMTFNPLQEERTFRIATVDYCEVSLVPRLCVRLRDEAPGIQVLFVPTSEDDADKLASGQIDLVIGARPQAQPRHRVQTVITDHFVCALRADHPILQQCHVPPAELALNDYLAWPHLVVAPHGRPGGFIDELLAKRDHTRRVGAQIQSFLAAEAILAATDMIAVLPALAAQSMAPRGAIHLIKPPMDLPTFSLVQMWHERSQNDDGHQWLRHTVREAAANESAFPSTKS